jgi:hypothetical protein
MLHWRVFDVAAQTDALPSPVLATGTRLDVRIRHEWLRDRSTGDRHVYSLVVDIENVGTLRVADYRVDVLFPKVFLDIENYGFEIHKSETKSNKLLRPPDLQGGLYPGEHCFDKTIKYSVDHQRFDSDLLMELPVEVVVYADGMASQRVKKPIRELQNF